MLLLRKGLPKQGIVRWWWSRRLSWERVYRCHAITSKGLCRSLDSSPPQREPPAAAACHRGKTLSLSSGSALSSSLSLAHTPLSPPLHLSLSPLSLSLSTLSRMDVPTRTLARIVVFEEGVSGKRTKVLPCSNATVASLQEALLHKLCSDHFGTRARPLPLLLQTHAEPFSLTLECLYLSYPPGNSTAGATQETRAMYADYKLYRVFEATPVPLPPNERVRIILPPISRPIYRNLSWSIYRDLSVVIYLFIFLAVSYNDSVQCC